MVVIGPGTTTCADEWLPGSTTRLPPQAFPFCSCTTYRRSVFSNGFILTIGREEEKEVRTLRQDVSKHRMREAILIALLVIGVVGSAERAMGQFFLCSAGPNDGGTCESDDDCVPAQGGACVVMQGVCDGGGTDGFPCDCPAGVCQAAPVCSADPSFGTCRGGTFNSECCDPVNFNCEDNAPCRGSQKICCTGTDKGFPCLDNSQCTGGGTCVSTGRFCSGGDFDSLTCCDNTDCGAGGECVTPVVESPTPTRPILTATRTLPGPSRTPTTPQPSPTGTLPTATRTEGGKPPTRTATPAAEITLVKKIGADTRTIEVSDGSSLPARGTILIDNERIRYTARSGNFLSRALRGVDGTTKTDHAAGAVVRLVDTPTVTPATGPIIQRNSSEAGGACAVSPHADGTGWWLLVPLAATALGCRRRR